MVGVAVVVAVVCRVMIGIDDFLVDVPFVIKVVVDFVSKDVYFFTLSGARNLTSREVFSVKIEPKINVSTLQLLML